MTLASLLCGGAADLCLIALWGRSLAAAVLGCLFLARPRRRTVAGWEDAAVAGRMGAIVPAYNEERSIEKTVSRLGAALGAGCRLLVIDDGSRDQTAARAEAAMHDPAMRLMRLPQNRGKAAALNAGVRALSEPFLLTVDADTVTDRASVSAALALAEESGADAVSFWIDVDRDQAGWLARLQFIEYATTMNFERAAQSWIGSISVMPGAATLFRASALPTGPFSARTSTEDADLTLQMMAKARHLVLCPAARARTIAPSTIRSLLRQRCRWTLGHLQCCLLHTLQSQGAWRFRWLTLPNFVLSTVAPVLMPLALLLLVMAGTTPVFHLTLPAAFLISTGLVYGQRLLATLLLGLPPSDWLPVLIEPIVSGFIQAVSFLLAFARLCSLSRHGRLEWGRPDWTK